MIEVLFDRFMEGYELCMELNLINRKEFLWVEMPVFSCSDVSEEEILG